MENQPNLCPFCGAEIRADARFCVKCGKPLQFPPAAVSSSSTPPPPPPPAAAVISPSEVPPPLATPIPPPPPSINPEKEFFPAIPPTSDSPESVQTIIGMVSRRKGFLGVNADIFHMVVTNERLIFAHQSGEMLKQDAANARDQAKQSGKNVFGQIGAQMESRSGDKYLGVSPDLILSENPNNFMIPLDALKIIETYSGGYGEDSSPDTMVVKTMNDKITFTVENAKVVNRELKHVLENRVK